MRFYHAFWRIFQQTELARLKIGFHCVICGATGSSDCDLCDGCESLLQRCQHTDRAGVCSRLCIACGREYFGLRAKQRAQCAECQGRKGPFSAIVAPYRYAFPLEHLVAAMKYRDQRNLARPLGTLLARAVVCSRDAPLPSLLVPVPLHRTRLQHRGYNQAADIARWCAHELGLTYSATAVHRQVDTGSLAGLSRAERQHQIIGAFRAGNRVAGQHVAIVDDVLTTGSTARELARELYDTGAEEVELWVLARTSSSRSG